MASTGSRRWRDERGIALAVLPGEDRDDPRLAECSTLPPDELAALLRYFREGGRDNLRALLRRLARHAGDARLAAEPQAVPRTGGYTPPGRRSISIGLLAGVAAGQAGRSRSCSTARCCSRADVAPIDALCAGAWLRETLRRRRCSSRASRTRSRPPSCATRCRGSRRRSSSPPPPLPRLARPASRTPLDDCRRAGASGGGRNHQACGLG